MIDRSLLALRGLNLAVAGMQTGLGAFLPVYLTTHGWSHSQIGIAISLAIVAALVTQIPGGALLDAATSKRLIAGCAILLVGGAAVTMAMLPTRIVVLNAQVVQGAADSMLGPSIAAITLALVGHSKLGERFGNNVRYAALGSMGAAAAMGFLGSYSHRLILYAAGAMGVIALIMLLLIRTSDLKAAPTRSKHASLVPRRERVVKPPTMMQVLTDRGLLVFIIAMSLFQLGNAAILPIATNTWSNLLGARTDMVVAAAIMLPQGLAAIISPWFGRLAERYGRRRILLLGFAAMPLRALAFAADSNPYFEAAFQAFDGITAAAFGVLLPLVVADMTHRTGRFNLTIGLVGVLGALGAAVGNLVAGWTADHYGNSVTFLLLGVAGLAAFALVAFKMPETKEVADPLG